MLVAIVLLVCPGCVTAKKYRLAKPDTPPATTLAWKQSTPPLELTLESLIIFHGPGSWKREARWDEYVITLANHGSQPVTLESASLIDLQGTPQVPGTEPWALEKLSYTNWDKYGKNGVKLLAGAGLVAAYVGASAGVAASSIMAGGAATGGVVALDVIPVVAVVEIGVVQVMNHNNRVKVEAEFNRRRLALPRAIPAGETVKGSLFFPMTPGPQRLTLRGKSGDQPVELTLELKPLAGLHLKPAGK